MYNVISDLLNVTRHVRAFKLIVYFRGKVGQLDLART